MGITTLKSFRFIVNFQRNILLCVVMCEIGNFLSKVLSPFLEGGANRTWYPPMGVFLDRGISILDQLVKLVLVLETARNTFF